MSEDTTDAATTALETSEPAPAASAPEFKPSLSQSQKKLAIGKQKEWFKQNAAERRQKKGSGIGGGSGINMLNERFAKSESALPTKEDGAIDKKTLGRNAVSTGYVKELAEDRDPQSDLVLSIIHNPTYREFFYKFLKKERSDENLDFFLEIEKFRATQNAEERIDHLISLWTQYIRKGAKQQVNLYEPARLKIQVVVDKLEAGEILFEDVPSTLLDEAQNVVFTHLKESSFKNFTHSHFYKEMKEKEDELLAPIDEPTGSPLSKSATSLSPDWRPAGTSSSAPPALRNSSPTVAAVTSPRNNVQSTSGSPRSPGTPPFINSKSSNSLLDGVLVASMPAKAADAQKEGRSALTTSDDRKKTRFSIFKFRNKKEGKDT